MSQPVDLTIHRTRPASPDDFPGGIERGLPPQIYRIVQAAMPELAFAARFLSRDQRLAILGIVAFILLLGDLLPAEIMAAEPDGHAGTEERGTARTDEDGHCEDAEACARRTWAEQTVELVFETDPDPLTLTRPELAMLVHLRRRRGLRREPFDAMVVALAGMPASDLPQQPERDGHASLQVKALVDLAIEFDAIPADEASRRAGEQAGVALIEIRRVLRTPGPIDPDEIGRYRTAVAEGIAALVSSLRPPFARAWLLFALLHVRALDRRMDGGENWEPDSWPAMLMRGRWRAFLDAMRLRSRGLGFDNTSPSIADRTPDGGVPFVMASPRNILLIGPRGCGKTTVAHALAKRFGLTADDLDDLVLADSGCSRVAEFWDRHGEPAWREAEGRVISDWLARPRAGILALGGGAPMVAAVQEEIQSVRQQTPGVFVIYLACEAEELRRRLQGQVDDRPSLTGANPLDEIEAVLMKREPTYRAVADVVVEVTGRTVRAVVDEVLSHVATD